MNENRGIWRGWRLNNGERVEGLLTYRSESSARLTDVATDEEFWVDSSTLGECTGLTDKNGKLIFEGDIITTKKYGKVVAHSNVNGYDVFEVRYEPAMFRLENRNRAFNLIDDGHSIFEVIGNIHDNPELMQKG